MMAAGMMGDSIGMHHVAAQSGRRTKGNYRTGVLSGQGEVLISQRRRPANIIHCNHYDREIKILSRVIRHHN